MVTMFAGVSHSLSLLRYRYQIASFNVMLNHGYFDVVEAVRGYYVNHVNSLQVLSECFTWCIVSAIIVNIASARLFIACLYLSYRYIHIIISRIIVKVDFTLVPKDYARLNPCI